MDNWDEIRTAFQVARLGTVSGAAEVLGVHHATVIRHIDALEGRLGVKLFQRHARGYTATEAGQDLLRVAQTTDEQFSQLVGRIKGQGEGVSGELVVTSLVSLAPMVAPILQSFQALYPDVVIRYLTGERVFRLEYGEAHVAIRAGNAPEQPDNVVQPFFRQRVGMFAARKYIDTYGMPKGEDDLPNHRFVAHDRKDSRAPYNTWLRSKVPEEAIKFRSGDPWAMELAVRAGSGIGFLPIVLGRENPDLVEIIPSREDWSGPLWLVTHVDLHRTTKVQAFLTHLKTEAKSWDI
ncbi:LysR family transcriptional regulator [Aliishimia ponticola]|uniref:LysR family transcriptional regulator n=1 Tax=Aliishimia ponticola TaxID=2499833 RepID=A0A4V3XK05_9RHOB|nr:LysR family transcriptional regulator [Aliishimia ponticola]THH35083.1 LysR family transcriptional regulator [Aliishimia ponticola]